MIDRISDEVSEWGIRQLRKWLRLSVSPMILPYPLGIKPDVPSRYAHSENECNSEFEGRISDEIDQVRYKTLVLST